MQNIYPIQQIAQPKLFIRHKTNGTPKNHSWLSKLKIHLQENLSNPQLSIPSIAADLFISERQLFRRVKELAGKTPNHFIQEVKLEKAYQLLLSGQYETIKEVALEVGFKRVDYFSNLFEKRYDQRPLEILK